MRLGFYYSALYETAEGFESFGPFVRYVEELTRHFAEVVVFAPVSREKIPYRGVVLPAEGVRVVAFPPFLSHLQALPHYFSLRRAIRANLSLLDAVIATHVAPFSELFHDLGDGGVPVIYYVGADPLKTVFGGEKYEGWKNWPKRAAARLYFYHLHRAMRQCLCLVNGPVLAEQLAPVLGRVEIVRSSVLRPEDFLEREDTCQKDPVRLLCVSYLLPGKDLEVLMAALALLLEGGRRVELHIAGEGPLRPTLTALAEKLRLGPAFRLLGTVSFGAELNRVYAEADMFVFASRFEGNPRVIIEAMAHSLPVVTTPCGSVGEHVRHEETGLFVPFQDPPAMARAVERFLDESELRRRCIRNAFREVREMTVANFVGLLAERAKAEVKRARGGVAGEGRGLPGFWGSGDRSGEGGECGSGS